MGSNMTLKQLDISDMLEAMHRTNPVAKSAHKMGNAAGVHGLNSKDTRRSQRRQNRQEARLVARGVYDDI